MAAERQINAIDATNGAAAVGDGARAVHVGAGGTYIEQQTVVIQERPRVEPNLFQVPFPRSDHFVGREEDLAQIHALLNGRERRPVGLCGLGGIGKTQLAVEYAWRHRDDYGDGIFWLTATDPWTWQAGLAEIATRLGLAVPDPDKSDAQMRLACELAAYLNGHPNALLIFDNVEAPADLNVSRVQGFVFAALGCRTLFTTRRRAADLPFAWLEVGSLPEDASLALLLRHESRRRALDPSHPDHPTARELCRCLGYLPLTLELAAAFLARNLRVTISAYLARIGKEGVLATVDRTHLRPEDLPTGHEPSIITTLAMQWEALADADARRALQTAALLGEAEQIPRARLALLTGLPDAAEEGYASPLEDALATLRDLSLVEELTANEVHLHPLVREFTAGQITDRGAFIEAAVANMSEALWNVGRLEAEVRARGVDAVVADLRVAVVLTPGPSPERRERGGAAGVRPLLRALDLDAHILRRWNPETEPAFFLQQWRNRCFEMGWDEPVGQAEALLKARRLPYLRELRQVGVEDPALVRTLMGHEGKVRAVAVTPDGHWAVSGSADETLRVWDLASGICLRTLVSNDYRANTIAVTPDGRTAVLGGDSACLKVWDLATGTCLHTMIFDEHGTMYSMGSVIVTPDALSLVTVWSGNSRFEIWDLTMGTRLRTFVGHQGTVHAVAATSDGRTIVSGSSDATLKVWDLTNGTCLRTLSGHEGVVYAVAVTPDGCIAVSVSGDDTLKVWDLTTGACLRTLVSNSRGNEVVTVTPDGHTAISRSSHNTLRIWDLADGTCLRSLIGHIDEINAVTVTPYGQFAISASDDGTLKVWDVTAAGCSGSAARHQESLTAVAVTSDGRIAVSGSNDRSLRIWDIQSGACLRTLEGHLGALTSVTLTQDGSTAISTSIDGLSEGTLKAWDLTTGICLWTGVLVYPEDAAVTSDRHFVVTVSRDRKLRIWDLPSSTCVRTLEGHTDYVDKVTTIPDRSQALSSSWDGTLKIWDLVTGACLHTLDGHTDVVMDAVITPDGSTAVSWSWDGSIRVWDLATGRCLRFLKEHTDRVACVALTCDGQVAVSGSRDTTLKVWNLATGACLLTLTGHTGSVWGVLAMPDNRTVVSRSEDRTVRAWNVTTGQPLSVLFPTVPISCWAIVPQRHRIIAGDRLGGVHFLEFVRWD